MRLSDARHRVPPRQRRLLSGLIGSGLALLLLTLLSLATGLHGLDLAGTRAALFAYDPGNSDHLLVRHLQVPRTLAAILVGAALGVAGVLMQALTRNPLADPGLLGVNAGASAAVATVVALFGITEIGGQMLAGLLGAGLAGLAVLLLGGLRQGHDPVRLVIAGTALSAVLLALTQIITVNSDTPVFEQFRHWAVGSLQGRGYDVLPPLALLTALGLVLALSLARSLDALVLGRELGQTLGTRPRLIWCLAAATLTLLTGVATAAAGPIVFIGLTAPHMARFFTGPNHRWLLPCTLMLAAVLMLAADTLGRLVARPGEVSVGIMAALIGGPFFVALVRRGGRIAL